MLKRILALGALLCFLAALRLGVLPQARRPGRKIGHQDIQTDAESRFAAGLRITRPEIDAYALSLIPGFSDTLIAAILENIGRDPNGISKNRSAAALPFQETKGIGPQRAKILQNYIAP